MELVDEAGAGGGWRAMKAGIIMNKSSTARGRTTRRYGSRQTNV